MVMHYLKSEGYVENALMHFNFRFLQAAEALRNETNLDFTSYEICDNIDLDTILMDFESFYFVKFNKYPKISKKIATRTANSLDLVAEGISASSPSPVIQNRIASSDCRMSQKCGPVIDFRAIVNQENRMSQSEEILSEERLLRPLGLYAGYSAEWKDLAATISRDIYLHNPNVHWDDIIGLESAKRLVKEAVVYPISYPQLFTGILSPWRGLLLYGPPGTGKTLLAKAVATECKTTFFNISASTIVSKWRGDSEKLVRVLFELARFHAPSTIFLDELDCLMSQRGSFGTGDSTGGLPGSCGSLSGSTEHEGSRRMKTELLIQMDGLAKSDDLVFLLAASNIPELDHAMLRRLEKRILVDLPNKEARKRMFENLLPRTQASSEPGGLELKTLIDYDRVAELTEGYSGSDIRLVCKESAMSVVRKIFEILEDSSGKGQFVWLSHAFLISKLNFVWVLLLQSAIITGDTEILRIRKTT
ncbi:unnamed protein product [Schistocephalus solidus]|uniref:Katanin p60 ATPase-containing subunit A-like 2 n=1 Tax=Schistocephalus solidus TaxID=70667 RepID=A0A3P7BHJ1_SCHSO|nr:unnamed protein product [Schistocephalus solidus]